MLFWCYKYVIFSEIRKLQLDIHILKPSITDRGFDQLYKKKVLQDTMFTNYAG